MIKSLIHDPAVMLEPHGAGHDGKPTVNIQKKWGYIQATKKDWVGTAPLKNNEVLFSALKNKAEILNKQHQSEFTQEDPVNMSSPIEHPSPSMPEIKVSCEGVLKLLLDLKENKASDPDRVPSRILKVAAEPRSHCLQLLFTASQHTGKFPSDWKQANITPFNTQHSGVIVAASGFYHAVG